MLERVVRREGSATCDDRLGNGRRPGFGWDSSLPWHSIRRTADWRAPLAGAHTDGEVERSAEGNGIRRYLSAGGRGSAGSPGPLCRGRADTSLLHQYPLGRGLPIIKRLD